MPAQLGNDRRVFIESATPGTYNEIKGQRDVSQTADAAQIDIGDKNSSPYGRTAPGNFNYQITMSGIVDLPDANGLERLYSQFLARAAFKIQIRETPFATGDVIFEGQVYCLNFNRSDPRNGERTYDVTFGLAAVPITDLLVAA